MAKVYRPAIISTPVLVIICVFSLGLFYWTIQSRKLEKQPYYRQKLEAAQLMQRCMTTLKNFHLRGGQVMDVVNDPNQTALIGDKYSLITTDAGNLEAKLTTTNANFAALMVQLFFEAGLKRGDWVAVALTGSMPCANIATLCAAKVLDIHPVMITSVGASMWGANNPDFTWLDMERVLADSGLLEFKSVAASLGGGGDIGRRLSTMGRNLIREAIERHQAQLIYENELEANIKQRLSIYQSQLPNKKTYAAYINIGGGYASIGHSINGRLIPNGVVKNLMIREYPSNGAIIEFGKKNIPIVHVLNIFEIVQKYKLAIAPVPLPEPGEGSLFEEERYNLQLVWFALILIGLILGSIIFVVRRKIRYLTTKEDLEVTL